MFTHHIFDDLVLPILPLDFEQVVAEVEEVEAPLLSQQHDDGAAGPVQPVPEALPGRTGADETLSLSAAQLWRRDELCKNNDATLMQ